MKTSSNRFGRLTGIIAISSLLLAPTVLKAQENEAQQPEAARQPERQAPPDAPDAKRVQRMLHELKQLQAAGKPEEARQLAEQIRSEARTNPQLLERVNRAMAERNRQPKSDRKEGRSKQAGPPSEVKIQHLREAAEHLKAAGYGEYAAKAREEIGRLEASMRSEKTEAARRKQASPRPSDGGPVMEELMKLRREMEELRGEVRRMKAQAGPKPDRPPVRPMVGPR